MNHHIYHVLKHWWPKREQGQWLLATVIGTEGSSYRKVGAMMMFNDEGFQQGVISGGCLESDVLQQAQRCWLRNQARVITYDMEEEGDVAWRLGIGCGGKITLLLQPVNQSNDFLSLKSVIDALEAGKTAIFRQLAKDGDCVAEIISQPSHDAKSDDWFQHTISPPPRIVVLGGGVDAQPVINIASQLGWLSLVNDSRARYARASDFAHATCVSDLSADAYHQSSWISDAEAIVLMHHQVGMDAKALSYIASNPLPNLKYLALLGPGHRCQRVLDEAGITLNDLPVTLQAPAGLSVGGDLPESIALSILAQAHATLFGGDGGPLQGRF